jgi:hypothetical protein
LVIAAVQIKIEKDKAEEKKMKAKRGSKKK